MFSFKNGYCQRNKITFFEKPSKRECLKTPKIGIRTDIRTPSITIAET